MTSQPAQSPPGLKDRALIMTSAVVVLGAFMTILDSTIVNVAIDTLSRDFHADLTTIQWVSTGYLLALATVIPLTGWAADRFGTKRLFLISVFLFILGSALTGTAQNVDQLILDRVLQGLGGGMVMPTGMTILTRAAGPERVGRIMAVVGVPMLMAPVLGPILGGWLVDFASWRWIFYVNIPIGFAALALAWRVLPRDVPSPQQRLDRLGLLLLSPGLTAFVYGLASTAEGGGLSETKAWAPMVAGLTLIALFTWHALRIDHGLLALRLMREQVVMRAASMTTLLLGAALFGTMFLLPLYYQIVRGESAFHTGLLLAPQGLGAALMMPLSGTITDRAGAGRIVPVGLVLIALGLIGFSQVEPHSSLWVLGGCQFVLGLGMGASMMPAMAAAYAEMTHDQVARATTTLNIIQRVCGSIGVALLSVILATRLTSALPGHPQGGLGGAQALPPGVREHVMPTIAASFGHTFWFAFLLAMVAAIPVWWLPRHPPAHRAEEPALADL